MTQRHAGTPTFRLSARTGVLPIVPVPTATGATVRFTAEPGGRDSADLVLSSVSWSERQDIRYEDRDAMAGGIARIVLRATRRGWTLKMTARGRARPLDLASTSHVTFTMTMGDARWCGEVTEEGVRERRGRFVGRSTRPMDSCPCHTLPTDTFAAIEERIFARHTCRAIFCHGGVPGRANLTLASGLAYDSLVGVPATADASLLRVDPGNPDASLLLIKVNGGVLQNPLWGMPMPIGDPGLDAAEVRALRSWIAAGAPRTGTVQEAHAALGCPVD